MLRMEFSVTMLVCSSYIGVPLRDKNLISKCPNNLVTFLISRLFSAIIHL